MRGERSTHDIDAVPEARNRERMGEWLRTADLAAILDTLERRAWRDCQIICPPTYWRLTPADVAAVRAAAVAAIEAAGGRVDFGHVVATVADGELRISLPGC